MEEEREGKDAPAITIRPLGRENAADFFDFFDHRAFTDDSPYDPCYCTDFHMTLEEGQRVYLKRAAELGGGKEGLSRALREYAQELIDRGLLTGYLAYADGVCVGWCNAGDRQNFVRAGEFDPEIDGADDYYIPEGPRGKVKSLVCFEIAPAWRGRGLAKALLTRVCADAGEEGYEAVEVYPREEESFSEYDYRGPAAMYRRLGFAPVGRAGSALILRKML